MAKHTARNDSGWQLRASAGPRPRATWASIAELLEDLRPHVDDVSLRRRIDGSLDYIRSTTPRERASAAAREVRDDRAKHAEALLRDAVARLREKHPDETRRWIAHRLRCQSPTRWGTLNALAMRIARMDWSDQKRTAARAGKRRRT